MGHRNRFEVRFFTDGWYFWFPGEPKCGPFPTEGSARVAAQAAQDRRGE
jgi:hypothetical protein